MRASQALTAAGAVGRPCSAGAAGTVRRLSGACLLAGSACTRFGIFQAGQESARDPQVHASCPSASASTHQG